MLNYFLWTIRNLPSDDEEKISTFCWQYHPIGIQVRPSMLCPQSDHKMNSALFPIMEDKLNALEPDEIQDGEFELKYSAFKIPKIIDLDIYFDRKPCIDFFDNFKKEFPKLITHDSSIPHQDWLLEWKKDFKPFCLIEPYWVVPTWLSVPSHVSKILRIDPGMAFGTGEHETTQLAAGMLCQVKEKSSVLDVGTGTGILALLASLEGAERVTAIDIDSEAYRVAQENFILNKMPKINLILGPLTFINEKFDLIVANIIESTLIYLKLELIHLMKPKGKLILSGILFENRIQFINSFLLNTDLKLEQEKVSGEWCSFLITKQTVY